MRVVELSTDLLPSPPIKGGAIERYVYQISRELSKLGVEVHLVSVGDDYHIERGSLYRHVYPAEDMKFLEGSIGKMLARTTSRHNRKLIYVNRVILQIFRDIQRYYGYVQIIHNHYFTTSFAPIIFKTLVNKRTLLICHYHNVPKSNLINRVITKHYDLHLAVSKFVRNEIVQRLKVHPQKVLVVHNAIDTSDFTCNESVRDQMRETFGIGKDEIVLLYVGRITPEKGLHHLVDAYKIISKKITNHKVTLLIAGPTGRFDSIEANDLAYLHYIQKLSHEYWLSGDIKYVGHVANVANLYAVADLVVVPSICQDSCPSTVLEALASCRPVVAYPVGGIPELLQGLSYDLLTRRACPVALADKIIEVLLNLHRFDGNTLREHVERNFSVNVIARKLKKIFEEHLN